MKDFPSRVVRKYLLDESLVNDFDHLTLPSFCESSPDQPNNLVSFYTTSGIPNNPDSYGNHTVNEGLMLRVRHLSNTEGYNLISSLVEELDKVHLASVTIDTEDYIIHSCMKRGSVNSLGFDSPESKRYLFTVNYTISISKGT